MQVVVLEQELEKHGGVIPESDVLRQRAIEEKKRMEELQD